MADMIPDKRGLRNQEATAVKKQEKKVFVKLKEMKNNPVWEELWTLPIT